MVKNKPDKKDSFFELLKVLWMPVTGFLGAIVFAYNFYQMWDGDSETLTYFMMGGGLVILIIALGWVSFKTKTIKVPQLYLPNNQLSRPSLAKVPMYPSLYQITKFGLILVLISIGVYGNALFKNKQITQYKH